MVAGTVVGVDLSLSQTAVVACPGDWDGNWSRVVSSVCGYTLKKDASHKELNNRCVFIAGAVARYARYFGGSCHYYLEGYSYASHNQAHQLGELWGVVRHRLLREFLGLSIERVPPTKARKLLLGKNPRTDPKGAVKSAFDAAGARFATIDEYDAMCVLNYGLSELGGYCFVSRDT